MTNYFGTDPSNKLRLKVLDRMQYVAERAHKNDVEVTPALNSKVCSSIN